MALTNEVLVKLAAPFDDADLEWRIMQAGKNAKGMWAKCVAYVTNRAIMQRLDDVVGPGNWRNECPKEWAMGSPGVLAGISIKVDGEWVTKWDGADQPDTEPVKGGFSNAMKRAAVLWGIGRDLYHREEAWAEISDDGHNYQPANKAKDLPAFRWDPPSGKSPAKASRKAQEPAQATNGPAKGATPPAALLPGKPTSWDGHGGKPLKDVPTKVLTAFIDWVEDDDEREVKFGEHLRLAREILDGPNFDEVPPALVPVEDDLPF
jgi:hypothetical protein